MRIDELDEFQGVTPQLVTAWLLTNGWTQTKPRWWERGEDGFLFDSETFDQQWFWTHALAAIYTNGNVQALLREINPRMRKGMPSEAARIEHGENKDWLCMGYVLRVVRFCWSVNDHVQMVDGTDVFSTEHPEDAAMIERCTFWPCDANGNKVRWPTDAEGKLL